MIKSVILLKGQKKTNWTKDFSQAVFLLYPNESLRDKVTEFLQNQPDPKGEFSFKNCMKLREKNVNNKIRVGYVAN